MNENFEIIWQRIVDHAGEQFQTSTGQVFRYEVVDGTAIRPTHLDHAVQRDELEKLQHLGDGADTGKIVSLTGGPSFIWAILADKRVGGIEERKP